jgi:biotin synthase
MKKTWEMEQLREIYDRPLLQLLADANKAHLFHHDPCSIQKCHLISIKTGGCQEDCKYCAQSSRYLPGKKGEPLMEIEEVVRRAKQAALQGATRVCLGAGWREVKDSPQFERILQMIREIVSLGVEFCCTLGMLTEAQAKRLKEAGVFAYNHNLDTSEAFYPSIITTRTYKDRLRTLEAAGKSGMSLCCGGILGMGESVEDRLQLLLTLTRLNPLPDSVPINQLHAVPGTPLANQKKVAVWDVLRMIATTRIALPSAMIRLAAGRQGMSFEQQTLAFLAGANSIFVGEKLLTVPNTSPDADEEMLEVLCLKLS